MATHTHAQRGLVARSVVRRATIGRRRMFGYAAGTQERLVGCPFRRRKLGTSRSSPSRVGDRCGASSETSAAEATASTPDASLTVRAERFGGRIASAIGGGPALEEASP